MAEVHALLPRLSHEGAIRLAGTLERAIVTNADLGPRWPQIQALGLSLHQLGRDLAQATDRMAFQNDGALEVEILYDSLYRMVDALSQLGLIAQAYASARELIHSRSPTTPAPIQPM